ncbi:MAG: hypothetical protein IT270_02165 [Saprospiraceae bacterium]|nr:hypothetical protein [Saprospiraceae bacterium]
MNILQIELLSNDLAATEHFYAQKMGLPVAFQNTDTITFVAGSSLLTFNRTDTTAYPRYHFAFNIPHNRLEEATAWVESFAEPLDVPDGGIIAEFVSWNARALYFYDNNGNILELIARFDLPNATDKPFDQSAILSISEMGVVADEVKEMLGSLIQNNNLAPFSKLAPREDFAALGDDEGLLILAKTQRGWYPTGQAAEKFSANIKFMSGKTFHEITLS